ncbi:hypothetical protein HPB49_018586 [Dermacentor silvarum]|uniref:Uncharacterized protein n=1 Tax=Dermacentor silvarum TaxID=543639 RepID=A0ACB8CGV8_DERSI|nr:alpha-(1,3)-fucosyltransferase C-like [Dermacentor silvarum]XP_049526119.1 alpha-(1,3)-fucosyltransferase C-like [Dermacentor silvarum]KAH7941931.1 hypothetical protein HPB49_018586 [Dermacentor silvarum]
MHPAPPSSDDDDGSDRVPWQLLISHFLHKQYRRCQRIFVPANILFCIGLLTAFAFSVLFEYVDYHFLVKPAVPFSMPSPPWTFWRQRKYDSGMPRILLWNRVAGWSSWYNVTICPLSAAAAAAAGDELSVACEITDSRARLVWSDAVVFEAERISPKDMPSRRLEFQTWVLWTQSHVSPVGGSSFLESRAVETRGHSHPGIRTKFDWTMGRRELADVVTPYKSWRCSDAASGSTTTVAEAARRNREALGYTGRARRDAVWIVGQREWDMYGEASDVGLDGASGTDSEREFVGVDLIPDCGRSSCGSRRECLREIASNYRFIVVTMDPDCFHGPYELIYDAFEYDLVPVLLASPHATISVPWQSVVYSAEFERLGTLVAFLRSLAIRRVDYERYFRWKERCSLIPVDDFCPLCLALNDRFFHGRHPPDACYRRMRRFADFRKAFRAAPVWFELGLLWIRTY